MAFNSLTFLGFFAVVYALYLILQRSWQNRLLLVASYVFYGYWDLRFLLLIWTSTLVDYVCGLALQRSEDARRRKLYLGLSLLFNLSILCYFKYANFFFESFSRILEPMGWAPSITLAKIILPIGISFYTFQSMGYTIDVFRRKITASRSLLDFALFISFFPQLLAGPIEKFSHLMPQMQANREIGARELREGIFLILYGYFQKLCVADNLQPHVNMFFLLPNEHKGWAIVSSLFGAAFYLYADYAGYSNVARGIGRLLGFQLTANFRQPSLALSVIDLWSKWNVTVTDWFKTYVARPLIDKNWPRPLIVILVTTLIGFWHGPSFNYLLWGFLSGCLVLINRVLRRRRLFERFIGDHPLKKGLWWLFMMGFVFIPLNAIFFVHSREDMILILRNLFLPAQSMAGLVTLTWLMFAVPMLGFDLLFEIKDDQLYLTKQHWTIQLAAWALLSSFILVSGEMVSHEFHYFQF